MEQKSMTVEEFNQKNGTPSPGEETQETSGTAAPGEADQEADGTTSPAGEEDQETVGWMPFDEEYQGSAGTSAVIETLEVMQQSVDQVNVGLQQLHVDVSLTFLSVVLLVGVLLGCVVSFTFMKMWRA